MEPNYTLACIVLIIILILFKYNLRVLHNRTKPLNGDQSKLTEAEKKKNADHWDKNFSDEDGYANIGIAILAVGGLYHYMNNPAKVSGGIFGGMFSGGADPEEPASSAAPAAPPAASSSSDTVDGGVGYFTS
jgi:hypothetical protein